MARYRPRVINTNNCSNIFRPTHAAPYEHMFFHSNKRAARALAVGIDIAIDFATLGEYRVIDDAIVIPPAEDAGPSQLWATGIEWSTPERTRATCSLPRARNRDRVMSRVRC